MAREAADLEPTGRTGPSGDAPGPSWTMNYLRTLCDTVETVWLLDGPGRVVSTRARCGTGWRRPRARGAGRRLRLSMMCAWRWRGCARWAAGPPKPPGGSPGPGRFLTALQAGPLHAIVDLDETAVALQVGERDTARTQLAAAGGQFEHSA